MAKSDAVWGIDIGNAGIKAIRCRPSEDAEQVEAIAFDYIEYPKILTQPGADPIELVSEALKQFQSRNNVRGDRVAIAVPGQNGLARFIKLPPVETKQIPQIVLYEARQQIPFDLSDVIWDYQSLGGGGEEIEGFALETVVGLFAMKREQVFRAIEPYQASGIEVEFVQLTPLALYNYIAFDRFQQRLREDYNPDDPPESLIVLSMGTDASDLVITDGHRVWQRSIPLGGNHFTRALTKEMKLTFAKAEHLKRNAAAAEDPKAVFQAMRSVFNDLVTEIQRSIGYFTSINRSAKIGGMVALGNAMKLPGLRRYLAQNLELEVERIDSFTCLSGVEVASVPAFKENIGAFGVAYGLAVQALGKSALRTNLLPPELLQQRMIRNKKPWAVAAAAVLLLGCTLNFVSHSRVLATVENPSWAQAESEAKSVTEYSTQLKSKESAAIAQFDGINKIAESLTGNVEGRLVWLELLTAVNQCLPADPEDAKPENIWDRNELHVTAIECQRTEDPSTWFTRMKENGWYWEPPAGEADLNDLRKGIVSIPAAGEEGAADAAAEAGGLPDLEGRDCWIVQLTGYHFHNFEEAGETQGAQYVRNTLIRNLHNKVIKLPKAEIRPGVTKDAPIVILPSGENIVPEDVSMEELGVYGATLVDPKIVQPVQIPNPAAKRSMFDILEEKEKKKPAAGAATNGGSAASRNGAAATPGASEKTASRDEAETEEDGVEPFVQLKQFDFVVQFVWAVTPPMKRAAIKDAKAKAEEEARLQAETAAEETPAETPAEGAPAGAEPSVPTAASESTTTPESASAPEPTTTPESPAPAEPAAPPTAETPPAAGTGTPPATPPAT
ncbi:MAG: type IV pilus assembly protein PilM [Planctomycetaceae bacterium]|nr:type IV pilus assembly protein PilM [Planctomycetaceae bacterium]